VVVLVRACGPGLGREGRRHGIQYVSAALSSAFSSGFALLGDLLFSVTKKVSKNACPCIRPVASRRVRSLRRRSEGRRTRAIHGPLRLSRHPCRSPLSTTAPLTLLKGRLVPPARSCKKHHAGTTAGDLQTALPLSLAGDVGWKTAQHFPPQPISKVSPHHGGVLCKPVGKRRFTHPTDYATKRSVGAPNYSAHCPSPIARPSRQHQTPLSGGRAQVAWKGLSGMDAARAAMGQGWPFAAAPWNVTGAREPRRSRGRMQGQDFLVPLGGAGHPATAKRNSPSRAKPARHTSAASDSHLQPRPQASHPTQPPAAHPKPAVRHCTRPQ